MLTGTRLLNNARFKVILETLASELKRRQPLIYLDWVQSVPAFEDELIGRFTGKVVAADIIADDQEAFVNDAGKVELSTNAVPNLKVGMRLGQAKLNMLSRLKDGVARAEEGDAMKEWELGLAERLVFGVQQRQNALACAMMMDSLSYDNAGIKVTGTWGKPSNLKVTPTYAWTDTTNADPLNDILTMDNVASDNYGLTYDTIIMSGADLDLMTSCAKTYKRMSMQLAHFSLSANDATGADRMTAMKVIGQVTGKTIVIDDASYYTRTNDGSILNFRYKPLGKVILARKENMGDTKCWDLANGIVTESMVADLVGMPGFSGQSYGPTGYYTARADLNPPDVVAWAVARCFPRCFVPEASAVLTVR